jgi:HSP20 family protein
MMDRFPVPTLARSCWRPAADVYRTDDGWLIKVELAGVSSNDLQVTIQGRRLKIAGQRRDLQIEVGYRCHSLEISYDRFERTFDFPCDVAGCEPQARFENGMLWIRVRKCPAAAQPG